MTEYAVICPTCPTAKPDVGHLFCTVKQQVMPDVQHAQPFPRGRARTCVHARTRSRARTGLRRARRTWGYYQNQDNTLAMPDGGISVGHVGHPIVWHSHRQPPEPGAASVVRAGPRVKGNVVSGRGSFRRGQHTTREAAEFVQRAGAWGCCGGA